MADDLRKEVRGYLKANPDDDVGDVRAYLELQLQRELCDSERSAVQAEMDAAAEREGKYVKTAQEQEADARKAQV